MIETHGLEIRSHGLMCLWPILRRGELSLVCVCVGEWVVEGLRQNFVLLYLIEEKSFGIETLGDCSLC